jgi:hypothetical protein
MAVTCLPLLPSNGRLLCLLGVIVSVLSLVRCSTYTLLGQTWCCLFCRGVARLPDRDTVKHGYKSRETLNQERLARASSNLPDRLSVLSSARPEALARAEVKSNTSTVTVQVIGGDEKGTQ